MYKSGAKIEIHDLINAQGRGRRAKFPHKYFKNIALEIGKGKIKLHCPRKRDLINAQGYA